MFLKVRKYHTRIMSATPLLSAALITLALVFYSLGVWSERIARYLKGWHVASFWIGFIFDELY